MHIVRQSESSVGNNHAATGVEMIQNNTGLLLHSDQGCRHLHKQYVDMLPDKGVKLSMGQKGNCHDNSVMENFFGQVKSELLYMQEFVSKTNRIY